MGFFTKQMTVYCKRMAFGKKKSKSITKKGSSSTKKARIFIQKIPFSERVLASEEPEPNPGEKLNYDEKRLAYMKVLLQKNVCAIRSSPPPTIISGDGKVEFDKYVIDEALIADSGGYTKKYYAKHQDFPEMVLVAKYIKKLDNIPNRDYLKMISYLGRKQTFIIGFWDIFLRPNNMEIIVIEDLVTNRDIGLYVTKSKELIPEWQCCYWLRQIYRALDFLGDLGICHRCISPRYILLQGDKLQVKLSHFYEAIIYWNSQAENINYLPCISRNKQKCDDYQAPEVYGNVETEEFDPIAADIWSMGAVMYFVVSRLYPYNVSNRVTSKCTTVVLKKEIDNNINSQPISDEGKQFLIAVLNPCIMQRVTFDKISSLMWLNMFKDVARNNGFI